MQKSQIEWTEFVSNPIKGRCGHYGTPTCGSYCYAEAIRKRFKQPAEMSWHPKELEAIERRKKPATIFMGSMYDIFGQWVPKEWIHWILDTAKNCPQHKFIFLTKNPARYQEFYFPANCYLGYSDDVTRDLRNWAYLKEKRNAFVSLEPLLGETVNIHTGITKQVIIGAQTGPGAIRPSREVVEDTIRAMDKVGIPIFLKDNLMRIYPSLPKRRELIWHT